jgi:hypothetical protein
MPAPDRRGIWVGSIVVDCTRLDAMVQFWTEALHYVPRDPPQPEGVVLKDPAGAGPNLNLSLSTEGPLEGYRLHLDLYATDLDSEVDRLLRLGATLRARAEEGRDFVTLADPDGNLFDNIDKRGWSVGRFA